MKPTSILPAGTRGLLTSALFFSVFANLLMLTGPLFMLQVYDRVLASRSEETLVALSGLVVILYLFYGLLEFARGRVMARVGARIQTSLSDTVFRTVIDRAADRRDTARDSLGDLDALRAFFGAPVVLALADIPWTPLFVFVIFVFHPTLGWVALTGASVLIAATLINQVITRRKTEAATARKARTSAFAKEVERGADLIRAQSMTPAVLNRWQQLQTDALDQTISASDWTSSFSAFAKAFRLFLQSAILAVGAYLVLRSEITAGAMIATSIVLGRALAPIDMGLAGWPLAQRARLAWRNLNALLADAAESTETFALPTPEARLAINDLSVAVEPGQAPILKRISLDIRPGEVWGIIGRSGGGKSTLARSLVGLTPPTLGDIRLDGATLDQYGADQLGQHIGYLPQDVHLFDATVAENIAQMAETPVDAKVIAAARKAGIHEIILSLPEGYATRIGGANRHLSGGQKQRIALARALYNDPVLLVLDEPNSALDADGSEALNAVIADMKSRGRSVIVMTHRPTALSSCDSLVILEQGAITAAGPRDEIIRSMMKNADHLQRTLERAAS